MSNPNILPQRQGFYVDFISLHAYVYMLCSCDSIIIALLEYVTAYENEIMIGNLFFLIIFLLLLFI